LRAFHALALEQLGDAEIEQLRVAGPVDEDVGRLDVAVDDQVGVRMGDGLENVEKEAEPLLDPEAAVPAIGVDRLALDVLEHEVGLAGCGHAGVEEPGDVGIGQTREDLALAAEPLLARAADEARVEQLDGGGALEAPVAAAREPDVAHASL